MTKQLSICSRHQVSGCIILLHVNQLLYLGTFLNRKIIFNLNVLVQGAILCLNVTCEEYTWFSDFQDVSAYF